MSQDAVVRASEHVVTCMIAAGYRIDPTEEVCMLWIADDCLVLHPSVINGVSAVLNAKAFAPCHTPAVAIA